MLPLVAYSQALTFPDGLPDSSVYTGKSVVITGVGDIMLGSAYPSSAYLPPHDNPLLLLGDLADTLASSDITFGNLEGSFLNDGQPVKKCRDSSLYYLFRMPEHYSSALLASGFDILSLANNHFGDFGYSARCRTRTILDSLGIFYAGLAEQPYSIFRRDSLVYGFCAFAPNAGAVNINDTAKAAAMVRLLADTCDIVIVSFHGGAEGADHQHVPRAREIFHGEDRGNVHDFAHSMIDAGADVIFGHGPHVTRSIEIYRERFISYSLGNFCTFGQFNISGPNGIAPVIKIRTDESGRFISGKIIPVFQTRNGGVKIDPGKQAIQKIQYLVAKDFPGTLIKISDEGDIISK